MNKKLNITSVTYERLVNLGNFENERLSATADIEVDQSPEEVFEYLCQWVNEQLKTEKRISRAEQKLQDLADQEKCLQAKIDKIKAQIEFLENQLIQISEFDIESEDIVF
jgi:predicted  nucleic acid-binding Zn-ribbon protein